MFASQKYSEPPRKEKFHSIRISRWRATVHLCSLDHSDHLRLSLKSSRHTHAHTDSLNSDSGQDGLRACLCLNCREWKSVCSEGKTMLLEFSIGYNYKAESTAITFWTEINHNKIVFNCCCLYRILTFGYCLVRFPDEIGKTILALAEPNVYVHLSSFRRVLASCATHHNFNRQCQLTYAGSESESVLLPLCSSLTASG